MARRVLCYGDSNTWGCVPIVSLGGAFSRYGATERWTGVAQGILGPDYTIIEEGLNGRTTVFDDPILGADRNGRTYLEPCLQSHMPLDLVIIMLGTNDLKPRFSANAFDIAGGAAALVRMVKNRPAEWLGEVPEVLLMAPPVLGELSALAGMFEGSGVTSKKLAPILQKTASALDVHFLNTGDHIASSPVDGVHFEQDAHQRLGELVAEKVRKIVD
ncbi:MAG: SGNH/GDSL hydrolase family protein [Proteobacteria bacterium]|nr:SGNH/GDSL hydrolase family protein [Pseudomonadota bacterium]